MKLRKLPIYAMICILFLGTVSCENLLKDFNLVISSEVIKHTAILEVLDTEGNAVSNVNVKLLTGDTEDIYNLNGFKEFKLTSNLVTFGVDPKRAPTTADPITFQVEVSATGYLTQIVPMSISDISSGIQPVRLVKPTDIPDGAAVVVENVALAPNGSTTTATTVTVENEGAGSEITITVPAGVQFRDGEGVILTGSALTVNVTNIDATDDDALVLFPGGTLRAQGVEGPNGETFNGSFNPAGTVTITMTIGGQQVREFSQPIQISMDLDPAFISSTGTPIAAGSILSIYSYTISNPIWQYEKNVTVTGSAATGFKANFAIDHLSTFVGGEFVESCAAGSVINFTADWITQGFTYPVVVQALYNDTYLYDNQFSVSASNKSISLADLPATGVQIIIRNNDGDIIAQGPLAACGTTTTLNLVNPNPEPKVTLQLYVRCPGQTNVITVLPTFQLFYRVSGTPAFAYLGEVSNGLLQTALLKSDGTAYDFRAVWNERTKTVANKTVEADNTSTVGTQPGDIIGVKGGATNLAMLTEECDKL